MTRKKLLPTSPLPVVMKRAALVHTLASIIYPDGDFEQAKSRVQQRIRYAISSNALPRTQKFNTLDFFRWTKSQRDWNRITEHPLSPIKEEMIEEIGKGLDVPFPGNHIPKMDALEEFVYRAYQNKH